MTPYTVLRAALASKFQSFCIGNLNANPMIALYIARAEIPGTKLEGSGSTNRPYRLVVTNRVEAEAWLAEQEAAAAKIGMVI